VTAFGVGIKRLSLVFGMAMAYISSSKGKLIFEHKAKYVLSPRINPLLVELKKFMMT